MYLRIDSLTKRFGSFVALDDITLDIGEREFVCFLGPSGCGKTTLLRAIAGLDIQTHGRIEQGGLDISTLPPAERDFGIVFQSYALFPNMTVRKNVAYGLENRKRTKAEIAARVRDLLQLVDLSDQGDKYPAQLSGGEQQRIALARALATSPGLLLLDEPLSALDAKVRVRLRHEIKELQRKLGVTTVMVTHDQEEALTMADRIVVMNQGVIEQIGTPIEIYREPATAFVADFIGIMNFLPGALAATDKVRVGNLELQSRVSAEIDGDLTIAVRPEDIILADSGESAINTFEATVHALEFMGSFVRASLRPSQTMDAVILADLSVNRVRRTALTEGDRVSVTIPPERIRIYPGTVGHG